MAASTTPSQGNQHKKNTPTPSSAPTKAQQLRGTIIAGIIAAIAIITLIVALVITRSHAPSSEAKGTTSTSSSEIPAGATPDGGFAISKATLKHAPQIEFYFDPLCPFCREIDSALSNTLKQLSAAGQVDIVLHPLNFLDRYSPDSYSTRAASTIIYVLQHDPIHTLNYLGLLFEHQPKENSKETFSNEQFRSLAQQAGVINKVVEHLTDTTYDSWLSKITKITGQRKDLIPPGTRGFGTPLIRINGHIWLPKSFEKSSVVSVFLHALGLESSQVGDSSQLPSIGRDLPPHRG